ncbi:MAG TPA: hypothetical protein VKB80_26275, partial [Kofleriaceae bacterium]|nr:hypothetical protein [Kofleriaceae bacterium]
MVARRRTESKVKVLVLHNTTSSGAHRFATATPESAAIAVESEADLAHLRGLADGLGEGGFDVALV